MTSRSWGMNPHQNRKHHADERDSPDDNVAMVDTLRAAVEGVEPVKPLPLVPGEEN
jgi:hypothetical protein